METLDIIFSLNTLLIMFATGVLIRVVRWIIPDKIENSGPFKVILRVLPMILATGLALIPGIRPMANNLIQSALIGFIAGSFAASAYELLAKVVRMRLETKATGTGAAPSAGDGQ